MGLVPISCQLFLTFGYHLAQSIYTGSHMWAIQKDQYTHHTAPYHEWRQEIGQEAGWGWRPAAGDWSCVPLAVTPGWGGSQRGCVCRPGKGEGLSCIGAVEVAAAGREEWWSGAVVQATALGCIAGGPLSGSPGAASLAWGQEGGGRLGELAWVLGNCSSTGSSSGWGVKLGAPWCRAWTAGDCCGSNGWTKSVSWLSWALMAWFSCVMHIRWAWMSLSSRSISSGVVSPGTCCQQNLHSLLICFPLGWLDQGCVHAVTSDSKPDAWVLLSDRMAHLGLVGSWWPCMGRPQEEQHGMFTWNNEEEPVE